MKDWNFAPLDVSEPHNPNNQTTITVPTSGLRGRLESSPTSQGYDITDPSSWLVTYDLTDDTVWNVTANFQDINNPYWFKNFSSYGIPYGDEATFCPGNGDTAMSGGRWNDFSVDIPGRIPHRFSTWPINFTATWIHGTARSKFFTIYHIAQKRNMTNFDDNNFPNTGCDADADTRFNVSLWIEIPAMQSLSCKPIIEAVDAVVTVNLTGRVSSYKIGGEPKVIEDPWKDVFVMSSHNTSDGKGPPVYLDSATRNVTTSYSIHFLASLLKAPEIGNTSSDSVKPKWSFDELYPNASVLPYSIRDAENGLSMDLMSHCIYPLANKDMTALSQNTTLFASLVDQTFQTFLQLFVNGNVSLDAGS